MRLMDLTRNRRNTLIGGLQTAKKVVLRERDQWLPGQGARLGRRISDRRMESTYQACQRIVEVLDMLIRVEWKKTHKGRGAK